MKPYKILIFLVLILLVLLIPTFFIDEDSSSDFRYPSFKHIVSIFYTPTKVQADTYVAQVNSSNDSSKISLVTTHTDTTSLNDSSKMAEVVVKACKIKTPDINTKDYIPIEYGNNPAALDQFFSALQRKEYKNGKIRVLHFADSQIEGDMITSSIRETLQSKYGGYGVGILPAFTRHPSPKSIKQSNSSGWLFYSIKNDFSQSNRFGIFGGLSKLNDASNGENIYFEKTDETHRNSMFNNLNVYLGGNSTPYTAILFADNNATDTCIVEPNINLNTLKFSVPAECQNSKIELWGNGEILVYGISHETRHGIFVDNIPVRGSAGTFFTKFEPNFANKLLTEINTKLIIVQYGINVIPDSDVSYYENAMTSQLKAIKQIKKDAAVILIGVSDMSQNTATGYHTNPNVHVVIRAQQRAARRAGVAFWNCFEAMGGENSMYTWATAKPALAQKDFTHFNQRGARIIAKLFTNSLFHDYNKYIVHQKNKTGATK